MLSSLRRCGARAAFLVASVLLLLAPGAQAIQHTIPEQELCLDFDALDHGKVIGFPIDGVTITADNPHRDFGSLGDLAVAFDTRTRRTADRDLEARLRSENNWSGGNIRNADLDVILILQENATGCADGYCDDPDDEGRRPAGELRFDFDRALADFRFDLIDVESLSAENASLEFFDGDLSEVVRLMDFVDEDGARYDPSIELGDNSANRFAAITAASLGLTKIDSVVLRLGGSGGIDNIKGRYANVIPEPGSALLIGLGLATLATRRRTER